MVRIGDKDRNRRNACYKVAIVQTLASSASQLTARALYAACLKVVPAGDFPVGNDGTKRKSCTNLTNELKDERWIEQKKGAQGYQLTSAGKAQWAANQQSVRDSISAKERPIEGAGLKTDQAADTGDTTDTLRPTEPLDSKGTSNSPPGVDPHALFARQNRNLLLEGVPGTGKTYAFEAICKDLGINDPNHRFVLSCHPSTQYEDVIEGLRPKAVKNDNPWQPVDGSAWQDDTVDTWHVVDGVLLRACTAARQAPVSDGKFGDVAILLDELNRANVPRMLGDLLTVMERSKRARFRKIDKSPNEDARVGHVKRVLVDKDGKAIAAPSYTVTLPVSGRTLLVPFNLVIVATMNSVDHSVAPLDQALLRRFWRVRVEPMGFEAQPWRTTPEQLIAKLGLTAGAVTKAANLYFALNKALKAAFEPDGMIGHSYLTDMQELCASRKESTHEDCVRNVWRYAVAPQVIAAIQAAGKEPWFAPGTKLIGEDAKKYSNLLECMSNCGFELVWAGEGAGRALRMNPV